MNKKGQFIYILGCVVFVLSLSVYSIINRQYNFVSMILVFLSCLPFYFRFENRKPHTREVIVLSVMITLTITSRVIFALVPGFKPMVAFIIIAGMTFGKEAGFLCGSLSAFVSNMFFGQGPWTPFQMLAYGLIGYIAGLLNQKQWLENKGLLALYGMISGIGYSLFMDIWTILSLDQTFHWNRYLVVVISAIPFMVIYAISNIIFLFILAPILLKRLERIKNKYGFIETNEYKGRKI